MPMHHDMLAVIFAVVAWLFLVTGSVRTGGVMAVLGLIAWALGL